MSLAYPHERLQLPDGLRRQLLDFRRRVWLIKMAEAACTAAFAVVAAYLLLFLLDRAFDTPPWLRATLFIAAFVGCLRIPAAIYRWIWRNRRLEQLAMLLARKHPAVGDQLLGIIELVRNDFEQARSRALCEAAVREVAKDAQSRDFRDAVPTPRHKSWAFAAGVPIVAAVALGMLFPAAARSAWARLLSPWGGTPRYTFAALEELPASMVVAHGEPFAVTATLAGDTVWHPARAEAQFEGQAPVAAALQDGRYEFDMPSQLDPGWMTIKVGDATRRIKIEPTLRPELTSLVASVTLPGYLGRPGALRRDVRGGAISLVQGSKAAFTATASRTLRTARVDGQPRTPSGASVDTPETPVKNSRKMELRWRDTFGLEGKEPFTLSINGRDDEAPSLACEDLPRQKVVLDSEVLSFKIHAQDDFGVRRVGMEWVGIDNPVVSKPAKGERILGAGGQDKEALELAGTFSARSLGIEPQPVQVRMFVEDYLPGRPRVYSPPSTFFVLTPEQHAIWITEQLSRWHRQAIEVKDREMQLHERNKELRALAARELDKPENRRKIEHQASAERQNGSRLTRLTNVGDMLVREAMRNPEFGVGYLEKWAEMLQILKDISGNRMPSVADLLKEAAQAPSVARQGNPQQPGAKPSTMNNQAQGLAQASQKPSKPAPMAGQVRASGAGKPDEEKSGEPPKDEPVIPRIVDTESSQNSPPDKPGDGKSQPPSKGGPAPLRLPVTTVVGKPKDAPPQPETPAEEKMEEAVRTQRDLLAEFEKIADELNRVLANLEGSTLLKRLKAAARLQYKIGGRITEQLGDTFGVGTQQVAGGAWKVLGDLGEQEAKASHDVSLIMDDMQSFFERRPYLRFRTVLDEMRKLDVIGSLRQLGDDLKKENGLSVAQCDYWSDTLDRWAEDLVDPASGGT